jgi:hypothetical protein
VAPVSQDPARQGSTVLGLMPSSQKKVASSSKRGGQVIAKFPRIKD